MVARRVLAPLVQVRALAGQSFDALTSFACSWQAIQTHYAEMVEPSFLPREVECPVSIAK